MFRDLRGRGAIETGPCQLGWPRHAGMMRARRLVHTITCRHLNEGFQASITPTRERSA